MFLEIVTPHLIGWTTNFVGKHIFTRVFGGGVTSTRKRNSRISEEEKDSIALRNENSRPVPSVRLKAISKGAVKELIITLVLGLVYTSGRHAFCPLP